jgi:energy-coupling factor transport system ATP-binding protein
MAYIDIEKLSYKYPEGDKNVLDNINLSIEKGEVLLLLGSSGSGKSTLAKCLCGSIPNFYGGTVAGRIFIDNCELGTIGHKERAKEITMVFQDPEKQLVMNTVHREIAFGLENIAVQEEQIKRRVWESLQFSNILDLAYNKINTLSGGQKQKVSITSAVAYMPKCIILDEPTSQLDPAAAEEVAALIKKINEELGITLIIIEQRIDRWFDMADKIAVMQDGKIAFTGSKEQMYNSNEDYLLRFLPGYLKLFKYLNMNNMPKNFKDARKELKTANLKFNVQQNKVSNSPTIINIHNFNCGYEGINVLKDIELEIKEGEFLGLLGANGAGKSTLLKAVTGLIKYSGSIKLYDKEVKKLKLKQVSEIIGYVSQNPNDYLYKDTVYEELKFTLDNYAVKDLAVIEETLRTLGISELKHRNPRDLSGGERQRVAIAAMLVLRPKVLLLDEPTRGLDSEVKKLLGTTLKDLNENGTTIVLVTHVRDNNSDIFNLSDISQIL